jgi:hypothetical protein
MEDPAAKVILLEFLSKCRNELDRLSGHAKILRFIELRYAVMSDLFPHGVFTVEEATLEFFDRAIRHSIHQDPLPEVKSEWSRNYVEWIKKHQKAQPDASR